MYHLRALLPNNEPMFLCRIKIILSTFLVLASLSTMQAQNCEELQLLPGDEHLINHGVDSTGHWWAITQPFTSFYHLYVDGKRFGPYSEVGKPVFSNDGSTWASVATINTIVRIITPERAIPVSGTGVEALFFASQTPVLYTVTRRDSLVTFSNGKTSVQVLFPVGSYAADPQGEHLYYVGQRGTVQALVQDGVEGVTADKIELAGIWSNGLPVVAVQNGPSSSVQIGTRSIVSNILGVRFLHVNRFGTALAFVCERSGGSVFACKYTDEMNEPWFGPPCDIISQLVLHPFDALVAYYGIRNLSRSVYFDAADYPAGLETGLIVFTNNGSTMAYLSRDGDDFISLNGRRYRMSSKVNVSAAIAVHPTIPVLAYATSMSIVMWDIEQSGFKLGKMCDRVSDAVYVRKNNAFQATGQFNDRLYLLTCRP